VDRPAVTLREVSAATLDKPPTHEGGLGGRASSAAMACPRLDAPPPRVSVLAPMAALGDPRGRAAAPRPESELAASPRVPECAARP
jgi:hypothetical protein